MKMKPIIPFEPAASDKIPADPEWIYQVKWDGVRILTYFDGKETQLFNRKLNERTYIFPELTDIKAYTDAASVILDGEVIALDSTGNPSFHEVMRRDGIRRADRVEKAMKDVTIYYMIFDILFLNGDWITDYPLEERLTLLEKTIKPNKNVQLVPIQHDGDVLFEIVKQHNLEGIVCKHLNSKYLINGKNSSWLKVKNFKDLIAVIGGVTYRNNIVNSMVLGLYDRNGQLRYIGHAGTGKLTRSEWVDFTKVIDQLKVSESPFLHEPLKSKGVQWLKPVLTVKIQYMEWPEGHSLRQPSIQAFVDQDPLSCTIPE